MTRPADRTRRRIVGALGRGHIAGPTLDDALREARHEVAAGASTTLAPWSARGDLVEVVTERCTAAVCAIGHLSLPSTVSVKLPDLGFDDGAIAAVLGTAEDHHVGIHLDSMRLGEQARTLEMLPDLARRHPRIGVTLPGRWRRSVTDVSRVVEAGVTSVRVVKGQWPDPADLRRDPARGMLEVVEALAGAPVLVGVATHDPHLAARCLRRLAAAGTDVHLEQLYGLDRLRYDQVGGEVPGVLVYVPFGTAYLPYALKQGLVHPSILRWAARDALRSLTGHPGPQRTEAPAQKA